MIAADSFYVSPSAGCSQFCSASQAYSSIFGNKEASGMTASFKDTKASSSYPEIGSSILSGSSAISEERNLKLCVAFSSFGCTEAEAIRLLQIIQELLHLV